MTLSKFIRYLVRATTLLRDVNAVQKGRIVQRLANRATGRMVGKVTRRLWW